MVAIKPGQSQKCVEALRPYIRHKGDDRGHWVSYELNMARRGALPRVSGVYAVYFDGSLVYIGQSVDIANRFSEHRFRYGYAKVLRTPWADVPIDTRITVKVKRSLRIGDWAMWEIRLINRLRPIYNSQHRRKRAA